MHDPVLANRLAALATVLDDAVFADTGELSESAVAALHVVRQAEPISIQDIAVIVGLTHSATVRLVDRLEKAWLVRRLSRRGREVMVEATARGKRRAGQLQERRLSAAGALLQGLDEAERHSLVALIDRMLAAAVDSRAAEKRICRLCDQGVCRGAGCPVDAAAERVEPPR